MIVKTSDHHNVTLNEEYITHAPLLMILSESNEDTELPIALPIPKKHMDKMYEYMIYTHDKPIYMNITYPCMKPMFEYMNDDWFASWFDDDIVWWKLFYNSCDYVGMHDLCKMIVGHVGYCVNMDKCNLNDILPDDILSTDRMIYDVNNNMFTRMTPDELQEYLNIEKNKWKLTEKNEFI